MNPSTSKNKNLFQSEKKLTIYGSNKHLSHDKCYDLINYEQNKVYVL
jgi:hypothetical protein